jgi:hypothetical protein
MHASQHQSGPEALADALIAYLTENLGRDLEGFIGAYQASDWLISADFCMGVPDRREDASAFTIFPVTRPLDQIITTLRQVLPRDLKKSKNLTEEAVRFLREGDHFSIAFLLQRPHDIFLGDLSAARRAIDSIIAGMNNWVNARDHVATIRKMQQLRQAANAKNFNVGLLSDCVLCAIFASIVAFLVTRIANPRIIGLFPDRDKITLAWDATMYTLFHTNLTTLCQRFGLHEPLVGLGFPNSPDPDWRSLYDCLVRVPDFIAGAASAFEVQGNRVAIPPHPKYGVLLREVFLDNPRIGLLGLSIGPEQILHSLRRITAEEAPATP